uniref:Uncharacterized protein n=1 Tax=Ditylenchus dipsaci TaxID=166011 RepID=A0A915DL68_9BILA
MFNKCSNVILSNIFVFGILAVVMLQKLDARHIYELDSPGRGGDLEDYSVNPGNADLISDLAIANEYIGSSPTSCFCCRAFVCHRQKRCPCSRYFF